jgi:hypothetical protein
MGWPGQHDDAAIAAPDHDLCQTIRPQQSPHLGLRNAAEVRKMTTPRPPTNGGVSRRTKQNEKTKRGGSS